jgi:hypothetical protein
VGDTGRAGARASTQDTRKPQFRDLYVLTDLLTRLSETRETQRETSDIG